MEELTRLEERIMQCIWDYQGEVPFLHPKTHQNAFQDLPMCTQCGSPNYFLQIFQEI